MKKIIALSIALVIATTLGFGGAAVAQKKHAPKPAWGTMLLYLGNLQSAMASSLVFDMKNVAKKRLLRFRAGAIISRALNNFPKRCARAMAMSARRPADWSRRRNPVKRTRLPTPLPAC